jgi:sterol 3beta-glucosyltransferase
MAAALRAGVPQLPCPFMLDQPHNAALLLALGVAPAVVPFDRRVSSSRLAPPLRAILDEKGEGALGARVRAESAGAAERFAAIVEAAGPCEAEPRARI